MLLLIDSANENFLFRGKSVFVLERLTWQRILKMNGEPTQRAGFIFTFPNKLTSDKCLNSKMLSIHLSLLISLKVEQLLFSLFPPLVC